MKYLTPCFIVLVLSLSVQLVAQESNAFLNREYWKGKPSIAQVKQTIKEGNNPAEANGANFDVVATAILADAPNETIKYLISQKGNGVNKLTHDGRTYIFWAAYRGNSDLMAYLISNGAKTDILDDHGYSIINFAAYAGNKNTKVYDLCLANGANLKTDVTQDGANALLLAAPKDDTFELTNYFISKGLSQNSVDRNGNGVFNYVARTGNIYLMDKLLQKGITGNDQAFVFAAYGNRGSANTINVYTYLESKKLNPNVANNQGVTPLHIVAARSQDLQVIQYLLNKGLSVNKADNQGNTPFIEAASRNNLDVLKILAEQVDNFNTSNTKGQTALTNAIAHNSMAVVAFLLQKGADSNVVDASGNNIAYYLLEGYSARNKEQFTEKFQALSRLKQIDLAKPQQNGNTWYHLAVVKNNFELLQLANTMDIDVNAKNNQGNTALILAAMKATDDSILKYLIEKGADKTITTDFGETVYELAQENELLKKNNVSITFLK